MITIKSESDIENMRLGGKILATVFEEIAAFVKVGVNAAQIDALAYETIKKMGAEPSFLGYQGFKYTTCISKNEEIVHGIPYPDKELFPGDICSIDAGVYYKGLHVDAARTFIIEKTSAEVEKLVQVTETAFYKGIEHLQVGHHLGEMSYAMQRYVEDEGLTVVRDLYSHGIGKDLHEDPLIPNYGNKTDGPVLKAGMTFAIEPMVNLGTADILTLEDKWTIITADKKWSAHYENTVLITDSGPEILTIQ